MENQSLEKLKSIIRQYEKMVVAYSGGADSAFVLKVSCDVLGSSCVKAVTAKSPAMPSRELENGKRLAESIGAEHFVVETDELKNPDYVQNSVRRCYFCKTELYRKIRSLADQWGISIIANGDNASDLGDYRPGSDASREFGVRSPLAEAGFQKEDIREWSRRLGLPTWDKPASPCLASRFPYGSKITAEKLYQIECGENFLQDLGFKIFRLRHFGDKARIELGNAEFMKLSDEQLKESISHFVMSLGFRAVIFDQYCSGRLNQEAGIEKNLGIHQP